MRLVMTFPVLSPFSGSVRCDADTTRVSKMYTVTYDGRGFWARDDALCVWFAYLADALEEQGTAQDRECQEIVAYLKSSAIVGMGALFRPMTRRQLDGMLSAATAARARAVALGTLTVGDIRGWRFRVAYRDSVEAERTLESGRRVHGATRRDTPTRPGGGCVVRRMRDRL